MDKAGPNKWIHHPEGGSVAQEQNDERANYKRYKRVVVMLDSASNNCNNDHF